MGIKHPKLIQWERTLGAVFDEIDDYLEDHYGSDYQLHPARAARGTTSNKEQDGLFNVGASYSAGFGSKLGAGYVIDVRMSTLSRVPKEVRKVIELNVIRMLREKLPSAFPGKNLDVEQDGNVYKIYGDLSL